MSSTEIEKIKSYVTQALKETSERNEPFSKITDFMIPLKHKIDKEFSFNASYFSFFARINNYHIVYSGSYFC